MTGTIRKKALSLLLALSVLFSTAVTFRSIVVEAQASKVIAPKSAIEIEQRLNNIINGQYGDGKKFNFDRVPDELAGIGGCSQCFGYARYVFYQTFGLPAPTQNYSSDPSRLAFGEYDDDPRINNVHQIAHWCSDDRNECYENIHFAQRGDWIQIALGRWGHSMILLSYDGINDQISVLDCNINYDNVVHVRTLSFSDFASKYGSKGVRIYRANNYPFEPLTTPTPKLDKETYLVGETINVKWEASSSESGIQRYWLNLRDKNNKPMFPEPDCGLPEAECGINYFTNSASFKVDQPGEYTLYVTAVDANNNVEVGSGKFTVVQGSKPSVTIHPNEPGGTPTISAPKTENEVKTRLDNIIGGKYGNGKTFPYSNTAVPASLAGTAGETGTLGYARYAFYQIFGKPLSTGVKSNEYELSNSNGNLKVIASCSGTSTAAQMKADILKTKPGDIIQGKGNGFYQTMIVYSHDENSITLLDCDNDYKCGIELRTRDWAKFSGAFKQYTIYRAVNYPNSGASVNPDPETSTQIKGDINGDGKVNVTDASELLKLVVSDKATDLNKYDFNDDGKINIYDVMTLMLRAIS